VDVSQFDSVPPADEIRELTRAPQEVTDDVRAIIQEVRTGGDRAVQRLTARFDRAEVEPGELAVPLRDIDNAVATLEPQVLAGMRKAMSNVKAVAKAQLRDPVVVEPGDGQRVDIDELPVRRAAAYVPGGRAPYPSTLIMCAVTAWEAGVDELAVCAPPGPGGRAHPLILAACGLCGVNEVYRMGGAQAIAALAYGTETVRPVDVIVGPGNRYVQEAKRQVFGQVGIDGIAGPSELVVVAFGDDVDAELLGYDLAAQAEHGADSLCVVISDLGTGMVVAEIAEMAADRNPSVADAPLVIVPAKGAPAAIDLANDIAPEHLQLVGSEAEALADKVRTAGGLFVGRDAGTAFGDYVAGSNHVLPTGGAARFASALSPATFRRRMATVTLGEGAASRLAPPGAALGRAEGFPGHAESMERRA
jgi:histidinol dehydrogenase